MPQPLVGCRTAIATATLTEPACQLPLCCSTVSLGPRLAQRVAHKAIDHAIICGDYVCMKKPLRLSLPFGTLKIASYLQLSSAEHDGRVPYKRFGRYYLIWKPAKSQRSPG